MKFWILGCYEERTLHLQKRSHGNLGERGQRVDTRKPAVAGFPVSAFVSPVETVRGTVRQMVQPGPEAGPDKAGCRGPFS